MRTEEDEGSEIEENDPADEEPPPPRRRGRKAKAEIDHDEKEPEEPVEEPVKEKVLVTEKELSKFKVVELREKLKERGADQKGLKAVLVTRLCELMNAE